MTTKPEVPVPTLLARQKSILDYIYAHEAQMPDRVYLTQPLGAGETLDYTWRKVLDQSRRMAAHIRSLGFQPGARIAILSGNCAHFVMAELAIWMAGGTTVAIYPTEKPETIRYVLEHAEASLLFVGKLDDWDRQQVALPDGLPAIALPLAPQTTLATFATWDAIIAQTLPLVGALDRAPGDLALICYTSGSTGQPKGVMHSFSRVTQASADMVDFMRATYGAQLESRVLSYLPLAHIYERAWVECASFVDGRCQIFFTHSQETFLQDIHRARPTGFISVPRLWLKFQQGVLARLPQATLNQLLGDPATSSAIASQIVQSLGLADAVSASSGSAPMPPELMAWYRRLGINLLEGYGMTEDFAYSFASTPEFNAPGCVGVPLPGVEVRIGDDGEILIRSPGQLVGYYKQPEVFSDALTSDGFFRTGDEGAIQPNGLLKITGRLKDNFKTSKGKYVAPVSIENLFVAHPMIEAVMVGGAGQPAPYAFLVLTEDWRAKIDKTLSKAKVEDELKKLIEEINASLASYERLQMIVVAKTPWSVDNGCLTPTLKIKRKHIESAIASEVAGWYAKGQPVIWSNV